MNYSLVAHLENVISFGDLPGAFFSLSLDLTESLENTDGGNFRVRRCRPPIHKTLLAILAVCQLTVNKSFEKIWIGRILQSVLLEWWRLCFVNSMKGRDWKILYNIKLYSFLIRHQSCCRSQEKRLLIKQVSCLNATSNLWWMFAIAEKKRLDESDYNVPRTNCWRYAVKALIILNFSIAL